MKKNKKLARALEDLDQAFENLQVQPLAEENLKRAAGGASEGGAGGFTCNFKCGPTAYWECG